MSFVNDNEIIYLDNNATTQAAPEVVEAMLSYLSTAFANAASPHVSGRVAATAVAEARKQIASSIGCYDTEVIFTSGATEANNLAILGVTKQRTERKKIITTAIEHKSVLEPCQWMSTQGYDLVVLPVSSDGVVDIEAAVDCIDEQTLLVSIQGANNEIGTIQPVADIAEIARRKGALVHCDASQMLGKVPVDVDALRVDYLSVSAHKSYGPKGIGALFVREGTARSSLTPIMFGGGQELGLRPGTLNVAAIVGFGAAVCISTADLNLDCQRISSLRNSFENAVLSDLPGISINGANPPRLPGTSSISIPDIPADVLMAHVPTLCISNGSACASGAYAASHVIQSLGYSSDYARSTIRISIGRYNTEHEINKAARMLVDAVKNIRAHLSRNTSCASFPRRQEECK